MANRLADAISPYLRLHAGNPVDWFPWGADAFDEARRRDVPVLVSIGYATCHWCHVMARESFSDAALAAVLNADFVAIKVDREELPDVDAAYLAAAGAFTQQLGWPLTAFVTPAGRMFFAGTYFPPAPHPQLPSFRQVLEAVTDAWQHRRPELEHTARQVGDALREAAQRTGLDAGGGTGGPVVVDGADVPGIPPLPDAEDLDAAVARIAALEDAEFGGFGAEPKFPVAPALRFLLGRSWGAPTARRTLTAIAASALRDAVEGGFFRYAVRRDWSEPHYERMLYDQAQLLRVYADAGMEDVAAGIAAFLAERMRAGIGFASAQDSESELAGARSEGGYYALDAAERARVSPPALDRKVLTGWNGLALGALAHAGVRLGHPEWVRLAAEVADGILSTHAADGVAALVRASLDGRLSTAPATLEDYGMLADGLLDVALAAGVAGYAERARELVDAVLDAGAAAEHPVVFATPGGAEPLLAAQGLAVQLDPSEGAYPSGWSVCANAAHRLYLLTADARYERAAESALRAVAPAALENPIAYGALLDLASALDAGPRQLVIVTPDAAPTAGPFAAALRSRPPHELVAVVTEARAAAFAASGFELFADRGIRDGAPTAYACAAFVCRLPVTDPAQLSSAG